MVSLIILFFVCKSHAVARIVCKIDAVSVNTIFCMSGVKAVLVAHNCLGICLFGSMEQDFEKVPNLMVWVLFDRSS